MPKKIKSKTKKPNKIRRNLGILIKGDFLKPPKKKKK